MSNYTVLSNDLENIAAKLSDFAYYNFSKIKNNEIIFSDIKLKDWRFFQIENIDSIIKESVFCVVNQLENSIFVVFKGSEPCIFDIEKFLKDWFVSDLKMLFGDLPLNFMDFYKYVKQIKNLFHGYKIYLTGHSLGGSIAQLLGAVEDFQKFKVFTFNAFGTKHLLPCLSDNNLEISTCFENIKNYCIDSDIVSSSAEHVGIVYTIEYNKTYSETIYSVYTEFPKIIVDLPKKIIKSVKYYLEILKKFFKTLDSHFMNNFKNGYEYKKRD